MSSGDPDTEETIKAKFDNLRNTIKDFVENSIDDKATIETLRDEYDSSLHAQQEAELKVLSLQQELDEFRQPGGAAAENLANDLEDKIELRDAIVSRNTHDAHGDEISELAQSIKEVDDAAAELLARERRRTAFQRIRGNKLREARDRSDIDLAQSRQIIIRFNKDPNMSDEDAKTLAAELQSQVVNTTRQLHVLKEAIPVPRERSIIDSELDLKDADNDTCIEPMATELDQIKEELRDAIEALEQAVNDFNFGLGEQTDIDELTAKLHEAEAKASAAIDRAIHAEQLNSANAHKPQHGHSHDATNASNEITALKASIKDLEDEVRHLKHLKSVQERDCEEVKANLRATIETLHGENLDDPPVDILEEESSDLLSTQDDVPEDLDECQKQLKKLTAEIAKLKKGGQVLQATLDGFVLKAPTASQITIKTKEMIESQNVQLAKNKNEILYLGVRLERTLREAKGRIHNLKEEVKGLEAAGPDPEAATTKNELAAAHIKITDLYKQIEDLQTAEDAEDYDQSRVEEISKLKETIAAQQEQIEELEPARTELDVQEEALTRFLEDGVNILVNEFAEMAEEPIDEWLKKFGANYTPAVDTSSDALAEAIRRVDMLLRNFSSMRNTDQVRYASFKSDKDKSTTESKKRVKALEQQSADCETEKEELQAQIDELTKKLSAPSVGTLANYHLKIVNLEDAISDLEEQLELSRQEMLDLHDALDKQTTAGQTPDDRAKEIEDLQKTVSKLNKELAEANKSKKGLEDAIAGIDTEDGLADCEKRVKELQDQIDNVKANAAQPVNDPATLAENKDLKAKLAKARQEAEDLGNAIAGMNDKKSLDDCQTRVKNLQEQLEEQIKEAAAKNAQIAENEEEIQDLQSQYDALVEEIEQAGVDYRAQIENADVQSEEEDVQIKVENVETAGDVESLDDLQSQDDTPVEEIEQHGVDFQAQIDTLEANATKQATRIINLEREIADLEDQLADCLNSGKAGNGHSKGKGKGPASPNKPYVGDELFALTTEVAQLQEGAEAGQAYIDEQTAGIAARDARITLLEKRVADRDQEIAGYVADINGWTAVVAGLEATQEELNANIERLEARIVELENENNANGEELSQLHSDHGGDAADVAALRKLIATLKRQIANLRKELEGCKLLCPKLNY